MFGKKKDPYEDRRKYVRINKNFVLSYHAKGEAETKYEITQLKNISMGGMCFVATKVVDPDTILSIELKTPYISERTLLTGRTLATHEKVANMIYEIRVEFTDRTPQSDLILSQLIEFFVEEEKKSP